MAQREGGPVEEIHPGDVVWFVPGEKHLHGATSSTAMTHIAIQERSEGRVVEWILSLGRFQLEASLFVVLTATKSDA